MSHKIGGFACGPDGPSNLAGGHHQRVDEDACASANVLVFAAFALSWPGGFGRRFAIEHLHTAFFVAADHQATVLERLKRADIKLTNSLGLGIKVFIMTIQPVFAFMRLEIDIL